MDLSSADRSLETAAAVQSTIVLIDDDAGLLAGLAYKLATRFQPVQGETCVDLGVAVKMVGTGTVRCHSLRRVDGGDQ